MKTFPDEEKVQELVIMDPLYKNCQRRFLRMKETDTRGKCEPSEIKKEQQKW